MKWFKRHKTKIDKVVSAEFIDKETNYPVCSINISNDMKIALAFSNNNK